MTQNQNMVLTAALTIVIIIALGIFAYTTFFSSDESINDDTNNDDINNHSDNTDNQTSDEEILLTIMHQDVNYTFTLSDLEEMDSISGKGRKINAIGEISEVYNYTGVEIISLMEPINVSSDTYQITVIASDNYSKDFTVNESNIEVDIYDDDGNISSNESATMIVAYKEGNQYYTEPNPLRIAFIGDTTPITSSGLWIKSVTTIEVSSI